MNEQMTQQVLHIMGNLKGGVITPHQATQAVNELFEKYLSEHLTEAIRRML